MESSGVKRDLAPEWIPTSVGMMIPPIRFLPLPLAFYLSMSYIVNISFCSQLSTWLSYLTNPDEPKFRKLPSDVCSDDSDELTHFFHSLHTKMKGRLGGVIQTLTIEECVLSSFVPL